MQAKKYQKLRLFANRACHIPIVHLNTIAFCLWKASFVCVIIIIDNQVSRNSSSS